MRTGYDISDCDECCARQEANGRQKTSWETFDAEEHLRQPRQRGLGEDEVGDDCSPRDDPPRWKCESEAAEAAVGTTTFSPPDPNWGGSEKGRGDLFKFVYNIVLVNKCFAIISYLYLPRTIIKLACNIFTSLMLSWPLIERDYAASR